MLQEKSSNKSYKCWKQRVVIVTGSTGNCRNDNLRCRLRRQSWHQDNFINKLQCQWQSWHHGAQLFWQAALPPVTTKLASRKLSYFSNNHLRCVSFVTGDSFPPEYKFWRLIVLTAMLARHGRHVLYPYARDFTKLVCQPGCRRLDPMDIKSPSGGLKFTMIWF